MSEFPGMPSTAEDTNAADRLLESLSGPARAELLAIARPVSFLQEAVLLKQGAPTRGAYLLRSGTVEVSVRLPGGEALTVAEIPAGGVLGEMALLERGTCSATVTAGTPVAALFIPREEFRLLVARHSTAAITLQHTVTRNLCAKLAALNARLLAYPAPEDAPYHAPPTTDPLAGWPRPATTTFDYPAFLAALPMFVEWEAEAIEELLAQSRLLELPRGQALFYEGMPATACYITVRGALEVQAATAPLAVGEDRLQRLRRLAILGPGHLLGYRSLLDLEPAPQSVRARARETTLLLELPRPAFLALYQGTTQAALRLQATVHAALLTSMAQTNVTLTRLVNLARLHTARRADLEAALVEQAAYAS